MSSNLPTSPAPARPEHKAAHCGSCGRYVGPYETCPYCGARISGRMALRAVKITAILIAVIGLAGLWFWSRSVDTPRVQAAEISGGMNMAYVRVEGRIARDLSYDPETGYLSFWIDDSTGEIHVNSYRAVTTALLENAILPELGDQVSLAGTLRVREDYAAITLNAPEHLAIKHPEASAHQIAQITVLDEGTRVAIEGELRGSTQPYTGLTLLSIDDGTGEITVVVEDVVLALSGPLPELQQAQRLAIEGAVSLYHGSPQITLTASHDLQILAQPVAQPEHAEPTPITDISVETLGDAVLVRGRIVSFEGIKGGMRGTLDDGTGEIAFVLWDDVYNELPRRSAFDVGAEISLSGKVSLYEDALELIPASAGDIGLEQAAPALPLTAIGNLSAADAGRLVRVRGIIAEVEGFSAGVKALLGDGTGKITVLIWSNIYQTMTSRPEAGMPVEVAGIVQEYGGDLELVMRSAYDWAVLED